MEWGQLVTNMFADNLYELRKEAGLTQKELGEKLGVSRAAIAFYETGQRTPDISFLAAAANFFGTTCDYLLDRSRNKKEEYASIGEMTGLSDKAIDNLNSSRYGRVFLDEFLSNDKFIGFIKTVVYYFGFLYANSDEKIDDYCNFMVTKSFMNIMQDIQNAVSEEIEEIKALSAERMSANAPSDESYGDMVFIKNLRIAKFVMDDCFLVGKEDDNGHSDET